MAKVSDIQNTIQNWVTQQAGLVPPSNYTIVNIEVINIISDIDYTTTINSNDYVYHSLTTDTAEDIAVGLIVAINLGVDPVAATNLGNGAYSIIANDGVTPFTLTVDLNQLIDSNKVIWEFANSPRPKRPFVSLRFPTIARFGDLDYTPIDDNGIRTILANGYWTLTINAFGVNDASLIDAIDMLENLKLSLRKQSVIDYLYKNYISITNVMNTTNITQIESSGFEQRATLDVIFYIVTAIDDDVGIIENVNAEGEMLNYDGSVAKEITINV